MPLVPRSLARSLALPLNRRGKSVFAGGKTTRAVVEDAFARSTGLSCNCIQAAGHGRVPCSERGGNHHFPLLLPLPICLLFYATENVLTTKPAC